MDSTNGLRATPSVDDGQSPEVEYGFRPSRDSTVFPYYIQCSLVLSAISTSSLNGILLQLPDITVLGPYTYLATEVVFGAAALALLVRADALARAGRTIAVLYPVAYVWDWYTLEVGVFAIIERTGVELLGIPIEEHVFILVVPAFVLGIHETLHDGGDRDPSE